MIGQRACKTFVLAFVAVALAFGVLTENASAIPSLRDEWHFFCSNGKPTAKQIAKLRPRVEAGGLKGGIASLNYACLLEIYESEQFQAKMTKFQDSGAKGAAPKLDNRNSAGQLKRASSLLEAAYRAAKTNPQAIYYHAYALALVGDVSTVNRFDELLTDHASSPLGPEAHLVLGEHYFERRDVPKAFREYEEVIKTAKPVVKAYTKYKVAWINFAVGVESKDVNKKRKAISDLVALKEKIDEADDARMDRLSEMIESDVIDLLVQQGDLAEAKRILEALKADDVYGALLERMAYVRLESNDAKGAYSLFAMSLKEAPERPEALQVATNLVTLSAQMNDIKRLSDNLRFVVQTFGRGKSAWRSKQKAPALKKASEQVEAMLFDYTTSIDRSGREPLNQVSLTTAKQLYLLFIKGFPKSKRMFDVKMLYSQLLFLLKDYLPSARLQLALLKKAPKGKPIKDIAELMVTAAQLAVETDKTQYQMPEAGTALSEQPIPPIRKTFAECLDVFVKLAPTNPNATAMAFTAAGIYYDFGHYDIAVPRYYDTIRRNPATDFAKTAAIRILVYFQKQNDKKGLAEAKKKIGSVPSLRSAPELAYFFQSAAPAGGQQPATTGGAPVAAPASAQPDDG